LKNKQEFDVHPSQNNTHSFDQQTLPSNCTQLLNGEDLLAYQTLNRTIADYNQNTTIPDVFYQAAQKYAERIALSYEGGKLTYRQLNEQSNQVAHMLVANGLQKGNYVAIVMERSK